MPTEIVQLSNRVLFDGTGTPPQLNFPSTTTSGNSIILLATTYNATNSGANVTSVTDTAQQVYTQVGRTNSTNQLMQIAVFVGYALGSSIQTLTVNRVATNTAISMIALEVRDLMSSTPVAIDSRVAAGGSTQLLLETAASTEQHSFVVGMVGWHWSNSPKNAVVPSGYTLIDQEQSASGNTLTYQSIQRLSSTTRPKSAVWTFAAQANGALGLLLAFRAAPAVRRIRVPFSEKIRTAVPIKYEVYTTSPNPTNPLGSYVTHGTLTTAPTDVYNGLVDLTIPVDTSNTLLEDGDKTVVLLEATVGGQVWTNSFSTGHTYAQTTSTSGTGPAFITTNNRNPLTVNVPVGTYQVVKLDATGAPTITWSVSDTTNFTISQTGQLSLLSPALTSFTVTATATNLLGSSSITVTANVASSSTDWRLTTNANGLRRVSDNTQIRLRGMNVFGVIPYGVPVTVDSNVGLDSLSAYSSTGTFISTMKTAFGSWFNCIRVPMSPLVLNNLYTSQRQRLVNLLTACAAQGIYVLAVPSGSGSLSDIVSRNGVDADQDETNSSAITTEVRSCHDALVLLAQAHPNLLIGLMDAPRDMTLPTWRAQCITWVNNLRSKGYTQPIFIDAPNSGYDRVSTSDTAAIRSADTHVVFMHQMFRDSGTDGTANPANTGIPGPWASVRSAVNTVSGISAIGRSRTGSDLGAGDTAWLTSYVNLWGKSTPAMFGWIALYDYNSVFGSMTGGSIDWPNVVSGPQPPTLNSYGTAMVTALNPA